MNHRKTFRIGSKLIALALGLIASIAAYADQPIGRVSAAIGDVQIKGTAGTRKAVIAAPVYEGETVVTGSGQAASVLLDSKVVVKLDADTEVRITQSGVAQQPADHLKDTHLQLGKGTTEVFLGKRGPLDGAVALTDTIATIDATGTVFAASYAPAQHEGTYFCEESKITVHPAAGGPATVVPANQMALVRDGKLVAVQNLDRQELRSRTSGLRALRAQSVQNSTRISQQHSQAAVIRNSLTASSAGTAKSNQKVSQLSGLLIARCSDLDNLAEKALNGTLTTKALMNDGIDGKTVASTGQVKFFVQDAGSVEDGDTVNVSARSCTDSSVLTLTDTVLQHKPMFFNLNVDVPNIIEIQVTDVSDGTDNGRKGNVGKVNTIGVGVGTAASGQVLKFTPLSLISSKIGPKQETIRVLVTK